MRSVKLTDEELDALHTSAISMWSALSRDKHVNPAELAMWYGLQDKLLMAKIRPDEDAAPYIPPSKRG